MTVEQRAWDGALLLNINHLTINPVYADRVDHGEADSAGRPYAWPGWRCMTLGTSSYT